MRMNFTNVIDTKNKIRAARIADENTTTFRAAVIILWAIENQTWNTRRISHLTGYPLDDVYMVTSNLTKNNLWDITTQEIYFEDDSVLSFTLVAAVAGGELCCQRITETPTTPPQQSKEK